jgi:hypothetical protein
MVRRALETACAALMLLAPVGHAAGDPEVEKLAQEVGKKGWLVFSARAERGDFDLSRPAMAYWELGKSRPQGPNRAALVALRGVGRREVKRMLGEKAGQARQGGDQKKRAKPQARKGGARNAR